MTEYRFAVPQDQPYLIDFINMVFSCSHEPHDFKAVMPKVYADGRNGAAAHAIALDGSGRIVGAVGLLPGRMHLFGETLKTGYIGSVSTHPYARGEGHMKRLMAMVLERAAEQGMDLIMLDGQRQRYGYYGFTRGMPCVRYTVIGANLRHALSGVDTAPFDFAPLSERRDWIDRAAALHEARPLRMERDRAGFEAILRTMRSSPFAVLKRGAFAGYLVVSDERDAICEMLLGDEADRLPALKAWMIRERLDELQIPAAPFDRVLNRALGPVAEEWEFGDATLLKVMDFPKVIRACMAAAASLRPVADGELSMWIDAGPLTIRVRGGAVDVSERAPDGAPRLSAMQAQDRLFAMRADIDGPSAPAGWLPLPLYIAQPDVF